MALTRDQLRAIYAGRRARKRNTIFSPDDQKRINDSINEDVDLARRGIKPLDPSLAKFLKLSAEREAREERTGVKERTVSLDDLDRMIKAKKRKERFGS